MREGPIGVLQCRGCRYVKVTRHVDTEADEEYFDRVCEKTGAEIPSDYTTPKSCPLVTQGVWNER